MVSDPAYKFEIARLLARERTDELTADERARLAAWLEESEAHRALRDRLADPSRLARKAEEYRAIDAEAAFRQFRSRKRMSGALRRRFLLRIAAVAAVATVAVGVWYAAEIYTGKPSGEFQIAIPSGGRKAVLELSDGRRIDVSESAVALGERDGTDIQGSGSEGLVYKDAAAQKTPASVAEPIYNTLEVPSGGEFSLQLSDGTRIWAASCTTLKYPVQFTGAERRIVLDGEAFFEVAPDKSKPFIVETSAYEVRAVGTSFDVMCYADESCSHVTLSTGCVECTAAEGRPVRLVPGQQAYYAGGTVEVREVDPAMYCSWMGDMFLFDDEEIGVVVRKLARWYGVRIEVAPGLAGKYHFRGALPKYADMNEALELLEQTTDIRFVREGMTIVVGAGSPDRR